MMTTTKFSVAVLLMAALTNSVHGHGQMTSPKPFQVTSKYRSDCYGPLKGAGDDELQWAPVENLSGRQQSDQPGAKTFDIMNGCRGMVHESDTPTTALTAGKEFTIEYYIQAPHPGYLELYIVKPKTDSAGKITYERDGAAFKRVDNFATNSDGKSLTATIPTSVTGCSKAGDCALQFYWHSDIANQTYPTCADITLGGSSSSGSAPSPASPPASSGGSSSASTPAATPTPTSASSPTVTPSAPASAPAPAPASGSEDCDEEYPEPSGSVGGDADADADCDENLPEPSGSDCDEDYPEPSGSDCDGDYPEPRSYEDTDEETDTQTSNINFNTYKDTDGEDSPGKVTTNEY